MINQREQQISDLLLELQAEITNKITAKGGTVQGNSLFELATAIDSIPTGGSGKDVGGMISKIATSHPTFNLQKPTSGIFTNTFNIAFGGGFMFGANENIEINIGG